MGSPHHRLCGWFLYCFPLPVFFRGTPHNLFKLTVKVGQVTIAAGKSNFGYHFAGTGQGIACGIDAQMGQMFNGPHANCFFKTIHKIAFA